MRKSNALENQFFRITELVISFSIYLALLPRNQAQHELVATYVDRQVHLILFQ